MTDWNITPRRYPTWCRVACWAAAAACIVAAVFTITGDFT